MMMATAVAASEAIDRVRTRPAMPVSVTAMRVSRLGSTEVCSPATTRVPANRPSTLGPPKASARASPPAPAPTYLKKAKAIAAMIARMNTRMIQVKSRFVLIAMLANHDDRERSRRGATTTMNASPKSPDELSAMYTVDSPSIARIPTMYFEPSGRPVGRVRSSSTCRMRSATGRSSARRSMPPTCTSDGFHPNATSETTTPSVTTGRRVARIAAPMSATIVSASSAEDFETIRASSATTSTATATNAIHTAR